MPRPFRLLPALALTLALPALSAQAAPESPLAARARRVLHRVVDTDNTFIRVHAAEVLIAFGEGPAMRKQFLAETPASESSVIRVGVWRILAETAPTPAEKERWVAKIEAITRLVGDTDRFRSMESLGKLQVRVAGPTLEMIRQLSRDEPDSRKAMPLWVLAVSGDPGSFRELAELLHSPSPVARQLAAYALRWLHPTDPVVLRRLAKVASREPVGSVAYPFLTAAAFMLKADPDRMLGWRMRLEHLPAGSTEDAQWEAAQALVPDTQPGELPGLAEQLDDPAANTRVGAAWRILATVK